MFKFLGALVGAVVLVVAINFAGDFVFEANVPAGTAGMPGEPLSDAPNVTTADVPGGPDVDTVPGNGETRPMATIQEGGVQVAGLVGDPVAGKAVSRKCTACHTFEEGGANKVGPNLWNTPGSPYAHVEGFNYSPALADADGEWTIDNLREWLRDPNGFLPGNKMTFAGIKNDDDLNNLIAYMQTMQPAEEIGTTEGAPAPTETTPATQTTEMMPAAPGQAAQSTSPAPATEPAAPEGEQAAAPAPAAEQQLAGDPANGQRLSRACAACHSFNEGGAHKVGPNLFAIMGADIASKEGYNYSPALQAAEGQWTVEAMDDWLAAPNQYIPGNKMTYAGMKKEQDRLDLIAYMQSLQ